MTSVASRMSQSALGYERCLQGARSRLSDFSKAAVNLRDKLHSTPVVPHNNMKQIVPAFADTGEIRTGLQKSPRKHLGSPSAPDTDHDRSGQGCSWSKFIPPIVLSKGPNWP